MMQHDIIITKFCPKCFISENTNLKKKEKFLGVSILLLRGTKKTSFKLKPQGELARSFRKTMFLAEDRASVNVLRQDWAQDVWGTIEKDHFAGEKWIRSRGWVMGSARNKSRIRTLRYFFFLRLVLSEIKHFGQNIMWLRYERKTIHVLILHLSCNYFLCTYHLSFARSFSKFPCKQHAYWVYSSWSDSINTFNFITQSNWLTRFIPLGS